MSSQSLTPESTNCKRGYIPRLRSCSGLRLTSSSICGRWELNQEVSPLLRLPPEIRNRIYVLVLTVGQIHVDHKPREHKRRIKQGNPILGGFRTHILGFDQNPWAATTERTLAIQKQASEITLLSAVCRQLYKETAVLPFWLNAWSFKNAHVMERYVLREKRLTLLQRRAIHTLFVTHSLSRATEKFFGGLRVIIWKEGNGLRKEVLEHPMDIDTRNSALNLWRDSEWDLYNDR